MRRKITLTIIMFLIITISIILIYPKKENKILSSSRESQNNMLSIMVEREAGTGKYVDASSFPSTGYYLNKDLSKCVNGSKISFNDGNVIIKGNKSDRCYAYFDRILPLDYIKMTTTSGSLSTTLIADLYRYQGIAPEQEEINNLKRVNDNYICLNANGCKDKTDDLMYRIIGITVDGNIKVIKNTSIGIQKWYNSHNDDIKWPESNVYNFLNIDENSYLSQLGDFKNKIKKVDWSYGYLCNANEIDNNGLAIYDMEIGKKAGCKREYIDNTWKENEYYWNETISQYIGLIYLSDFYLSLSNDINCRNQNCDHSWMFLPNNEEDANKDHNELVLDSIGYSTTYNVYCGWHIINSDSMGSGKVYATYNTHDNYIRPVFYLNNNILLNGKGTVNDPYIVL